jgi:hypothetical protein
LLSKASRAGKVIEVTGLPHVPQQESTNEINAGASIHLCFLCLIAAD